jgi:hypothetical protein
VFRNLVLVYLLSKHLYSHCWDSHGRVFVYYSFAWFVFCKVTQWMPQIWNTSHNTLYKIALYFAMFFGKQSSLHERTQVVTIISYDSLFSCVMPFRGVATSSWSTRSGPSADHLTESLSWWPLNMSFSGYAPPMSVFAEFCELITVFVNICVEIETDNIAVFFKQIYSCKIWGYHGSDYEECCLLGCAPCGSCNERMYCLSHRGDKYSISWQPVSAASYCLSPWRWRRYITLKHRFLHEPHSVTSQKTTSSDFVLLRHMKAGPDIIKSWRVVSSGMLRHAALVRTDISEEPSASFIRVTRIGELGRTLAARCEEIPGISSRRASVASCSKRCS